MKVMVFDTETTNIEKPFCYNIGYLVYDTETDDIVLKREYVVEQVWHNPMLYTTAYYSDKREQYVKQMKARKIIMDKYGYITQQMIRDIKAYEITTAYAYNSPFDTNVFNYNCEWFKTNNPFDNITVKDIRAYVHNFIAKNKDFQDFCEREQEFTESGNYSTTAETLYRFISGNVQFNEEHTALADSEIELEILKACIHKGAKWEEEYKTYQSIVRATPKKLELVVNDQTYTFDYRTKKTYQKKDKIILKNW